MEGALLSRGVPLAEGVEIESLEADPKPDPSIGSDPTAATGVGVSPPTARFIAPLSRRGDRRHLRHGSDRAGRCGGGDDHRGHAEQATPHEEGEKRKACPHHHPAQDPLRPDRSDRSWRSHPIRHRPIPSDDDALRGGGGDGLALSGGRPSPAFDRVGGRNLRRVRACGAPRRGRCLASVEPERVRKPGLLSEESP